MNTSARLHAIACRTGGLWLAPSSLAGEPSRAASVSCEPAVWVRGTGETLEILPGPAGDRGWRARIEAADPRLGSSWDRLATLARRLRLPLAPPKPSEDHAPPRFRGGFAGCLSYDLGRQFEEIPQQLPSDLPWDFLLGFYDEVLEWTGTEASVHSLNGSPERLRGLWDASKGAVSRIEISPMMPSVASNASPSPISLPLDSNALNTASALS